MSWAIFYQRDDPNWHESKYVFGLDWEATTYMAELHKDPRLKGVRLRVEWSKSKITGRLVNGKLVNHKPPKIKFPI